MLVLAFFVEADNAGLLLGTSTIGPRFFPAPPRSSSRRAMRTVDRPSEIWHPWGIYLLLFSAAIVLGSFAFMPWAIAINEHRGPSPTVKDILVGIVDESALPRLGLTPSLVGWRIAFSDEGQAVRLRALAILSLLVGIVFLLVVIAIWLGDSDRLRLRLATAILLVSSLMIGSLTSCLPMADTLGVRNDLTLELLAALTHSGINVGIWAVLAGLVMALLASALELDTGQRH
jgi:hypothetical protein